MTRTANSIIGYKTPAINGMAMSETAPIANQKTVSIPRIYTQTTRGA